MKASFPSQSSVPIASMLRISASGGLSERRVLDRINKIYGIKKKKWDTDVKKVRGARHTGRYLTASAFAQGYGGQGGRREELGTDAKKVHGTRRMGHSLRPGKKISVPSYSGTHLPDFFISSYIASGARSISPGQVTTPFST